LREEKSEMEKGWGRRSEAPLTARARDPPHPRREGTGQQM